MESRKIILMNLFTGQEWRCRLTKHRGGRRGRMNQDSSTGIYTLP